MSLIKCPRCGKDISDKATKCVHCGHITGRNICEVKPKKKERKSNYFKHESANQIASICEWKEATHDIYNSGWGYGDELRLKMHTYYASQMDVLMFCGDLQVAALLIRIAPYDSYGEHYGNICDCIFDNLLLANKGFEMVGYNSIMCLGIGIIWKSITEDNLKNITENLAEAVYKFRQQLVDYGYDATGFRLR